MFEQPHNRVQPIWWRGSNLLAVMSVDPKTGYFGISGFTQINGIRIADRGGISGSAIPARNLRGIALPVAEGAAELKVSFERPEADTQFALVIQPSWATATAVMAKAADAFTVQFKNPAPAGATIDWFLVR